MSTISIITAALTIMSGGSETIEVDHSLHQYKDEIVQKVENLQGSRLSKIKEAIDIMSKYELNIQRQNCEFANLLQPKGVAYSTDPARPDTKAT